MCVVEVPLEWEALLREDLPRGPWGIRIPLGSPYGVAAPLTPLESACWDTRSREDRTVKLSLGDEVILTRTESYCDFHGSLELANAGLRTVA